jgi:hypothetical protein
MTASINGKTWEELEAIEQDGRLLFPDAIRRKSKDGTVAPTPIAIRVLRKGERRAARREAREWASREGVDPALDPELFEDLDTLCILARAIRDPEPPHAQFQKAEWLEQHFDNGSLAEVWDRYPLYESRVDPRVDAATEKDFWQLVLEIGRTRSISPLTGFAPRVQHSLVLSMADQALLSPTLKSWLESRASSTPAP